MKQSWLVPIVVVVIVVSLVCCLCFLVVGIGGWIFTVSNSSSDGLHQPILDFSPTVTPQVIRPTNQAPNGSVEQVETAIVFTETLKVLENTVVPSNDLPDLARRLEGKQDIPNTVPLSVSPLIEGTQQLFWVSNVDTNTYRRITATLIYLTEHVYFWVEDDITYQRDELVKLVNTFEERIYPTDREFFGSEWSPGVDEDPHLYILYASDLGFSLAGYFSSSDEYHPLAHEYSNAHEMFMLNADDLDLGDEYTYGVLAHEFQHMIHWYRDRNEETWMNEGFSELAAFLNGYEVGGFDSIYTLNPDLQVNDWPNDSNLTAPHYGASFLFLTYFLDRYGEQATKALVADTLNGMVSVDNVLAQIGVHDPIRGKTPSAEDVFLDWVLASYLKDGSIADGRYTYHNYPNAPQTSDTETVRTCPTTSQTREVHQFGVDYIRFTCQGDYQLHFEGSTQVAVLDVEPHSGAYAFWSNKGDESDMTLTQTFDFSAYQRPLTLQYWTWYDLEEDYDYLYLEASMDGENWEILTTPSGTAKDPSGNSYGWGYNGESGGWVKESVDLSKFAGKQVYVRFEYVTDAAVNGEGMLIDDITIPEIDYFTDFEDDQGGWEAEGWVRIQNTLPQNYRLALIRRGSMTSVDYISLPLDNSVNLPLHIGGEVEEIILVVAGTTRYTRQTTGYRFEIQP